ncbi:uncharacterized protein LOC142494858 [Ascaphus truei]|uniref:uncharacterized protein LOC142494858 n=1 Tax=Ascaphus truei TaxID=8439 RepID=UPI003F59C38D
MGAVLGRMRVFVSGLWPLRARVLLLGLDSAGKTTILYRLKLQRAVTTVPTIGHNVETLETTRGVSVTMWDVGLGAKGFPLCRHYFAGTHGLVFVVDSRDTERHGEAKENLYWILTDARMVGVPFIVLANKQDLEGARSPAELALDFELEKWKYSEWEVCGCCAPAGEGLLEALEKLNEMIKEQRIRTS